MTLVVENSKYEIYSFWYMEIYPELGILIMNNISTHMGYDAIAYFVQHYNSTFK